MKQFLSRAAAVCALAACGSQAWADSHSSKGFYVGAGGQVSHAELTFDKTYAAGTILNLSGITGTVGITPLDGAAGSFPTRTPVLVTARADEDTKVGYGFHVGYRINETFAIELGYTEVGDFAAIYSTTVTGPLPISLGGTPTTINLDASTLSFKASEDVKLYSGSVLGNYPVSDTVILYGRLGYFLTDTSESLDFDWKGSIATGGTPAPLDIGGQASLSKPVVEEATGLIYGGGVELAFGPERKWNVRAEINVLDGGLGEIQDIYQYALNASYSF